MRVDRSFKAGLAGRNAPVSVNPFCPICRGLKSGIMIEAGGVVKGVLEA
ncbi:MAG: hypothetical protein V1792_19850 [Pseudomonadota bacterium]